jgi:aspartyl/asparaginyl-tRNA synthetase
MAIACVKRTTKQSSAFAAEGGDSPASAQKDVAISYQARPMRPKRTARSRIRVTARFRRKGRNDKNSSVSKIKNEISSALHLFFQSSNWHFP